MFKFILAYINILRTFYAVQRANEKALAGDLEASPSLTKTSRKRILKYALDIGLTNMWFASLRGKRVTEQEARHSQWMAAATAIYDQLQDEFGLTDAAINNTQTQLTGEARDLHALFQQFVKQFTRTIPSSPIRSYYAKVAIAQTESARLLQAEKIPAGEMTRIAFDKGGYALLVWRCALLNKLVPGEEEAVYHLGALTQLTNDIFGIYKDVMAGEQTRISTASNLFPFKKEFDAQITKTIGLFAALPYPEEAKEEMLYLMIAGLAWGSIALDRLLKLQGNETDVFDPRNFSRAQLVCDMDEWPNRINSFKECLKWRGAITRALRTSDR